MLSLGYDWENDEKQETFLFNFSLLFRSLAFCLWMQRCWWEYCGISPSLFFWLTSETVWQHYLAAFVSEEFGALTLLALKERN